MLYENTQQWHHLWRCYCYWILVVLMVNIKNSLLDSTTRGHLCQSSHKLKALQAKCKISIKQRMHHVVSIICSRLCLRLLVLYWTSFGRSCSSTTIPCRARKSIGTATSYVSWHWIGYHNPLAQSLLGSCHAINDCWSLFDSWLWYSVCQDDGGCHCGLLSSLHYAWVNDFGYFWKVFFSGDSLHECLYLCFGWLFGRGEEVGFKEKYLRSDYPLDIESQHINPHQSLCAATQSR